MDAASNSSTKASSSKQKPKEDVDDLTHWYLEGEAKEGATQEQTPSTHHTGNNGGLTVPSEATSPNDTPKRQFFTMYSNDESPDTKRPSGDIKDSTREEPMREETHVKKKPLGRITDLDLNSPPMQDEKRKSQEPNAGWSLKRMCKECFGKCFGTKTR